MQTITTNQLIILHELTKEVLDSLKFNSQQDCFELSRPLSLTFELSHYRELQETEKILSDVLENIQGMAPKNTQAADLLIQPGNDAGAEKISNGT